MNQKHPCGGQSSAVWSKWSKPSNWAHTADSGRKISHVIVGNGIQRHDHPPVFGSTTSKPPRHSAARNDMVVTMRCHLLLDTWRYRHTSTHASWTSVSHSHCLQLQGALTERVENGQDTPFCSIQSLGNSCLTVWEHLKTALSSNWELKYLS